MFNASVQINPSCANTLCLLEHIMKGYERYNWDMAENWSTGFVHGVMVSNFKSKYRKSSIQLQKIDFGIILWCLWGGVCAVLFSYVKQCC